MVEAAEGGMLLPLPLPSALESISLLLTSQILLPSGETASEPLLSSFSFQFAGQLSHAMKLTLGIVFRHSNEAERMKTRRHSSMVDPDPHCHLAFSSFDASSGECQCMMMILLQS